MSPVIERDLAAVVRRAAKRHPAITLTGPRQSGKSTLCQALFPGLPYTSLEAPDLRAFASEDPRGFLAQFPAGAVIDEVQRVPDLPSYLQGRIDADPTPGRWILTGSQHLGVAEAVGQSLAGRSAVLHLLPLARSEVLRFAEPPRTLDESLIAGGYPRIFDQHLDPSDWLRSYVATYIERDVRSVGGVGDLTTFQRFVELCAGRSGQLLNMSALAADVGVSQPTVKAWLSVLEASFLVVRLPAYHSNLRKRLTRMPKLHFVDSGLACWLLRIRTPEQLRSHPLRGAIFESWVVSEILKHRTNAGEIPGLSHYRDRDAVEADAILERGGERIVVEAKAGETASTSLFEGAKRVQGLLGADGRGPSRSVVVYGGNEPQRRGGVDLVPWHALHEHAWA